MSDQAQGSFVTPLFWSPPQDSAAAEDSAPLGKGNVGVCLSGGGSRAMSAAIGQLQAMAAMRVGHGNFLSKVAVMTTVSGGGWVGIPFAFLPAGITDEQFLGPYTEPQDLTGPIVDASGEYWIGGRISQDFTVETLAVMALTLSRHVETDMLWQTLMGIHFLYPYGLSGVSPPYYQPTAFYTYNAMTLERDVVSLNPQLAGAPVDLVADASGQVHRPYLISVCGMFVSAPGNEGQALAPVQSTMVRAGIVPVPAGARDGGGHTVGGCSFAAFGFNSTGKPPFATGKAETAAITQDRQWSLVDALGTSSAAFAATLEEKVAEWLRSPERLAAALSLHKDAAVRSFARAGRDPAEAAGTIDSIVAAALTGEFEAVRASLGAGNGLSSLIPAYPYWTPADPPRDGYAAKQQFADGGSLDNSGITSVLFYPGIDTIVAFINTATAVARNWLGEIVVDPSIPPLFGYQPKPPYNPYDGNQYGDLHRKNQVFPSASFDELRAGLLDSIGGDEARAPIYKQVLPVVPNAWFGIEGGRQVTVLWVHLGMSTDWSKLIGDGDVQEALRQAMGKSFPHYGLFDTGLNPVEVNLLSNLTAWTVFENADLFRQLVD